MSFRLASVVLLVITLGGCTSVIFQPIAEHYRLPYQDQLEYEELTITETGLPTLHGWHLPVPEAVVGGRKGTVLFLHGNAQNLSTHTQFVYWLPAQGYEVYVFDYRGYGKSAGIPELGPIIYDISRMITFTAEHAGNQVIVFGHSLGASMAVATVALMEPRPPVKALVIASAFSDYRQIVRELLAQNTLAWLLQWPLSLTIDNQYAPRKWIGHISPIPVYLLHSREDQIIAEHHAETLLQQVQQPSYFFPLVGRHNEFLELAENRRRLLDVLAMIK